MPVDRSFSFQPVNLQVPRAYVEIYNRFQSHTMIPGNRYIENIMLADHVGRGVPGDFVECGTWRGGMACGLMAVSEAAGNAPDRHFHFFDSFEGLPPADPGKDGIAAVDYQKDPDAPGHFNNCSADYEGFAALVHAQGVAAERIHIHRGWFQDTVGHYAGGPISVLRLDGDWYESTMTCLEALYPLVSPGGAIIIDDYDDWDGCSLAVHDYLSRHRLPARIHRTVLSRVAFLIKVAE
jgi:O-methyltransferase